jgi:hypothetical protein
VKKPNWLRWGPDSTKSDDLKKVRQRTDQIIKRQEAQKELQGDGQEEASELIGGKAALQPYRPDSQIRTKSDRATIT